MVPLPHVPCPQLALQDSSAHQPVQQAFQHTLQGLMIKDPSDCATLPPPQLSEELKITVWGGAPEPLSCVVWRWQAARAKQAHRELPATSSPGSRKPKALGEATQPRPSQENGPRPWVLLGCGLEARSMTPTLCVKTLGSASEKVLFICKLLLKQVFSGVVCKFCSNNTSKSTQGRKRRESLWYWPGVLLP